MRNKTKLAKIKKKSMSQCPKDWLYMCPKEVELKTLKEMLEEKYSIEYWEEAGVLEVELEAEEASSVDFEAVDMRRADEVTETYMKEQGIQTVFLVSIRPEDYEAAKKVMKQIISAEGGFFCGDTEDFMPLVKM